MPSGFLPESGFIFHSKVVATCRSIPVGHKKSLSWVCDFEVKIERQDGEPNACPCPFHKRLLSCACSSAGRLVSSLETSARHHRRRGAAPKINARPLRRTHSVLRLLA